MTPYRNYPTKADLIGLGWLPPEKVQELRRLSARLDELESWADDTAKRLDEIPQLAADAMARQFKALKDESQR